MMDLRLFYNLNFNIFYSLWIFCIQNLLRVSPWIPSLSYRCYVLRYPGDNVESCNTSDSFDSLRWKDLQIRLFLVLKLQIIFPLFLLL